MDEDLTWPAILETLLERRDLAIRMAAWAMSEIVDGSATQAQIAGFLMALRAKGTTVEELIGFRDAVLDAAVPLPGDSRVLDIVGTGGDRHHTVNISTMAGIVVAACGVPVLKHGNRAVSSLSGASDVLSVLELVPASEDPGDVRRVLEEAGITFALATRFHPGFAHASPVRAQLGVATVFNYLGPLLNPARPEVSLIGVADREVLPQYVGVLATRGGTAVIVRGEDGLDELTTTGHSELWEIARGDAVEHDLDPRELGIPRASLADLRGGSPEENADILRRTIDGAPGPVRDIVLLNAAAALSAWQLHADPRQQDRPLIERLGEQLAVATNAIDSGAASRTLAAWAAAASA